MTDEERAATVAGYRPLKVRLPSAVSIQPDLVDYFSEIAARENTTLTVVINDELRKAKGRGMTYDLPLPISTNALYFKKAGGERGKTKRYEAWVHSAAIHLMVQKSRPIGGPVKIHVEVSEQSQCDIDNCAKCILDALVRRSVIEEDRREFVRGISLEWSSQVEGMHVNITPAEEAS